MNQLFYPAIFHTAEEGGFWISFLDFPECLTEGDDMNQAYQMASDALDLAITSRLAEGQQLPPATDFQEIKPEENCRVVLISFDMLAYKKKNRSRAVKKTLSIPQWLNEEAMELDINFSQVLQEALLSKIQPK